MESERCVREGTSYEMNAEELKAKGIQTRNLFAGNILRHPCFEGLVEGVDYRVAGTLDAKNSVTEKSVIAN